MHCYICDREQSNISFNVLHNDFDPCHTCQEVIDNVFGDSSESDIEIEIEIAEPTTEELLELENSQYELDLDIEEMLGRDDFS